MTSRYALITGASSGIGEALAVDYAAPGVALALTGAVVAALEEAAAGTRKTMLIAGPLGTMAMPARDTSTVTEGGAAPITARLCCKPDSHCFQINDSSSAPGFARLRGPRMTELPRSSPV